MDGPQYRYENVTITKEFHVDKMPPVEIVAKLPSRYYYDENKKLLYIHTSDGKHPKEHEIEIIMRLTGISSLGKTYITVNGFTFRHMGDSGISFSTGTGNSVAINNTVYGSRVGIRVRDGKNITLYGNTLFRNENSGIYFLSESTNGLAINNISYENIKGIRWGSRSNQGFALNNILFDNIDAGLSVEIANDIISQGNRMANNKKYQLLLINGEMSSLDNCFEKGDPKQLLIEFISHLPYATPSEGQKMKEATLQSLIAHSREGNCGTLPEKIDVQKLHEETMNYTEKARKMLETSK
jgi:parallel beta-helix repeat protein